MIDKRLLKGIDKRLLKDVLTIKKVADKNDYGDEVYSEPLTIKNVRFDIVTVDNSWMGAKVNDGIGDYTINGFQTNYYDGEIFSQEIEVI
ncbi:putative minor capsid protein [Streptococcus pneumoniae]|uniref:putative minor capsid protein n=1 Tax=Streptococcus pneumoniae TaxID=1313 RepID=UPI0007689E31|nr:putative minor capsid protein [Streptococcus pneumoniae]CXG58146.1 minor capsid protein 2 [Streptococcus pneumoniae]